MHWFNNNNIVYWFKTAKSVHQFGYNISTLDGAKTHCFFKILWQPLGHFTLLRFFVSLFLCFSHKSVICRKCFGWCLQVLMRNRFGVRRCTYVHYFMTLGQMEDKIFLFKCAFSTVCSSASLWPVYIRLGLWPCGMTLYHSAKFCKTVANLF